MTKRMIALLSAGVAMLAMAAPAQAQDSGDGEESTEIVVTAQKRAEPLRTIAASVQAIGGENLENRGLRSLDDMARLVPSLTIAPETGLGDRNIVMRGVAPSGGSQPTVITYLDDILIPNSVDPQLYDLSRVEVLKGPQGDLYGASAVGGLIRYIETKPDPSGVHVRAEASGSATSGGAPNYGGAAVVNLPLGSEAAVRVSGVYNRKGGFIDNIDPVSGERRKNVNDVERFTGRVAAGWTPSDALEIRASAMYNSRINGAYNETDRNDRLPDGTPSSLRTSRFFPERGSDKSWIFSLTANLDVGIGTLTSATGYLSQRVRNRLDLRDIYNASPDIVGFSFPGFDPDANGAFVDNPNTALLSPYIRRESLKQFTQEVRFSSDWDFPVQLLLGGFYLRSMNRSYFRLGFEAPIPEFITEFGGDPDTLVDSGAIGRNKIEEWAGFANLSWKFAGDRGEIKGGVRVYDRKNPRELVDLPGATFLNAVDATAKDKGTLFSAAASYKLTPTLFTYGRYASGFRPGVGRVIPGNICNADFADLGIDPSTIPSFTESEKLDSYEAGIRKSSSDGRFSVSATGFLIKYRKIQQSLVLPTCAAIFDVNAGKATVKGFEIQARMAPSRSLSFTANAGYTNSRLDETDPFSGGDAGEQLQFVPTWTVSIQQDYRKRAFGDWDLVVRSDISFTDKRKTEFGPTGVRPDPITTLPDYTLINAQIGVARDGWEIVLFGDNLTNALPVYGTNQTRYFGSDGRSWSVGTPRTLGIRARSSF